jgi:serine/threonine-protein kinase RsbW
VAEFGYNYGLAFGTATAGGTAQTGTAEVEGFEPREHAMRAELASLKDARNFAARAAEDFGLDAGACYDVRLAMSEAVTNAIRHGSSSSRDEVRIVALVEGDMLVFEVLDTGRFVPRVARRGEMPDSGRGLEFMRRLMDEVEVQPGLAGTRVRFAKRRGSIVS